MKIIRVFPRRTRATPEDENVRVNCGPGLFDEADEVHVSVAFTWDLPLAERLARAWLSVAPVKIGGPATGERSEGFEPGVYIRKGYTITSRGCPNRCWFCSVWRREGQEVRELPVRDGWNVLDDNLLACSEAHVRRAFDMLRRQPEPIDFSGGWEAARLREWHVDLLTSIRLNQVWFAYDTPDDYEPLVEAGRLLNRAGLNETKTGRVSHRVRAYCLIGYPGDSFAHAEARMRAAHGAGFLPMAMLYKDHEGRASVNWRRFQKTWARPASINAVLRDTHA